MCTVVSPKYFHSRSQQKKMLKSDRWHGTCHSSRPRVCFTNNEGFGPRPNKTCFLRWKYCNKGSTKNHILPQRQKSSKSKYTSQNSHQKTWSHAVVQNGRPKLRSAQACYTGNPWPSRFLVSVFRLSTQWESSQTTVKANHENDLAVVSPHENAVWNFQITKNVGQWNERKKQIWEAKKDKTSDLRSSKLVWNSFQSQKKPGDLLSTKQGFCLVPSKFGSKLLSTKQRVAWCQASPLDSAKQVFGIICLQLAKLAQNWQNWLKICTKQRACLVLSKVQWACLVLSKV